MMRKQKDTEKKSGFWKNLFGSEKKEDETTEQLLAQQPAAKQTSTIKGNLGKLNSLADKTSNLAATSGETVNLTEQILAQTKQQYQKTTSKKLSKKEQEEKKTKDRLESDLKSPPEKRKKLEEKTRKIGDT